MGQVEDKSRTVRPKNLFAADEQHLQVKSKEAEIFFLNVALDLMLILQLILNKF